MLLAVGSPLAWLAWSGPLVMFVFLRWISGIPYTEAQALRTRGDDYRDYQRTHADAVPWFPQEPSDTMDTDHDRHSAESSNCARDRRAPGLLGLAERGWLPDALLRHGIRRLCAQRLREERAGGLDAQAAAFPAAHRQLRDSPVAIHTEAANAQHYELPPAFFELCLGQRLKYSGCYYPRGDETLDEAEEAMLALYGERAELADGQDILELGCGWGSLTLWMAERYPQRAHHRGVQLAPAARTHRGAVPRARARQRAGAHLRRQPAGARRRRSSTAACRSRCSSTCATTTR